MKGRNQIKTYTNKVRCIDNCIEDIYSRINEIQVKLYRTFLQKPIKYIRQLTSIEIVHRSIN